MSVAEPGAGLGLGRDLLEVLSLRTPAGVHSSGVELGSSSGKAEAASHRGVSLVGALADGSGSGSGVGISSWVGTLPCGAAKSGALVGIA